MGIDWKKNKQQQRMGRYGSTPMSLGEKPAISDGGGICQQPGCPREASIYCSEHSPSTKKNKIQYLYKETLGDIPKSTANTITRSYMTGDKKVQLLKLHPQFNNFFTKLKEYTDGFFTLEVFGVIKSRYVNKYEGDIIWQGQLQDVAAGLNNNMWPSEKWFHSYYQYFRHEEDHNNEVFKGFIPDVINEKFKYVVEVGGSVHKNEEVFQPDIIKCMKYHTEGYLVIRVQDYNYTQLKSALDLIHKRRGSIPFKTEVLKEDGSSFYKYEYPGVTESLAPPKPKKSILRKKTG